MNGFERRNPIVSVLYFAAVIGMTMFSADPVLLALSLVGAIIASIVHGTRASFHGVMLLLFATATLINPLFSHGGDTVLFVMNDNPITLEALIYGAVMGMMMTASMYWFCVLSQLMTSDKWLYVFSLLSPRLALLLSMSLRGVSLFARQARRIFAAQKTMGMYRDDTIVDSFRGGVRVSSVMVSWGIENGIVTADSMAARGYGIGRRTTFRRYRMTVADILRTAAVVLLVTVATVCLRSTETTFYPRMTLTPWTVESLVGYGAFAVLVLLPLIDQLKEALQWAYYRSRM